STDGPRDHDISRRRRAARADRDAGCTRGARGGAGRAARGRGALRRPLPLLALHVRRLSPEPWTCLARLAGVRAAGRRVLPAGVRVLTGADRGRARLAARRPAPLPAAARLADPAPVLGGPR